MRISTHHTDVSAHAPTLTLSGQFASELGWQVRINDDQHAYVTAAEADQMSAEWQRIADEIRQRTLADGVGVAS